MENDKKLYMYVYRMILNDMYNGHYTYQNKLPSLLDLCEQYGVGRNTMRSALNELQQDGYIVVKKGVQAKVIFNINNPEDFRKYKQELVNRKKMLQDAYETMELILPEVVVRCLAKATPKQMEELNLKVDQLPTKNIQNARELVEELYNIYLQAFSILENPLLNDIFITIMYSVNPATIDDQDNHHKLQQSLKMLKTMMKAILKFSKKNEFIIKKGITKMCIGSSHNGMNYINELCEGMTVTQEKEFVWISHKNMDYLYTKVVGSILRKIFYREYHKGTKLPSIQKISEEYDVSEKTTRKSLDVLREFKVIETINGVGSIVIINDILNNKQVIYNSDIMGYIKQYFYSVELLSLIIECIAPKILKKASQDDLIEIKKSIENTQVFTLEPLTNYIFSKSNKCLKVIYEELIKIMVWSIFINQFIDSSKYDFIRIRKELYCALESQNVSKICYSIKETLQASLEAKEFIYKENGMSL